MKSNIRKIYITKINNTKLNILLYEQVGEINKCKELCI